MANLVFTDDNGNVYNFPESFWLLGGGIDSNINVVNSSFAAGGRNISDGFLKSRVISIKGIIQGDTQQLFENEKRAFIQACIRGGKLSISNDVVSRDIDLRFPVFSYDQEEGQQLIDYTVDFVAEFGLWEDTTETVSTNIVAGNDTITVTVAGDETDFLVKPTIEVDADQSVDLPGVKMTNKSDGATSFTFNSSLFTAGDILTINTKEGSVKRNGSDEDSSFDGNFLRLQPGDNIIDYEGAACTIIFKFKKVYM